MRLRRILAPAAAAALALGAVALTAPASHAQDVAAYTCDVFLPPNLYRGHCVASGGAPAQGPFTDAYVVDRRTGHSVFCDRGFAQTPAQVSC
ncbi:hypothetical protein ACFV0O_16825 [Kitasatospora sp. NPDC059577]|uniref:hypothetical protein n=1 Tax=unclassified Kitasatospora TaxID=2633591 RepID=UPI00368E0371